MKSLITLFLIFLLSAAKAQLMFDLSDSIQTHLNGYDYYTDLEFKTDQDKIYYLIQKSVDSSSIVKRSIERKQQLDTIFTFQTSESRYFRNFYVLDSIVVLAYNDRTEVYSLTSQRKLFETSFDSRNAFLLQKKFLIFANISNTSILNKKPGCYLATYNIRTNQKEKEMYLNFRGAQYTNISTSEFIVSNGDFLYLAEPLSLVIKKLNHDLEVIDSILLTKTCSKCDSIQTILLNENSIQQKVYDSMIANANTFAEINEQFEKRGFLNPKEGIFRILAYDSLVEYRLEKMIPLDTIMIVSYTKTRQNNKDCNVFDIINLNTKKVLLNSQLNFRLVDTNKSYSIKEKQRYSLAYYGNKYVIKKEKDYYLVAKTLAEAFSTSQQKYTHQAYSEKFKKDSDIIADNPTVKFYFYKFNLNGTD